MKYYHLILNQAAAVDLLRLLHPEVVVVVADPRLLRVWAAVVLLRLPVVAVDPDLHLPLLLLVPERNK